MRHISLIHYKLYRYHQMCEVASFWQIRPTLIRCISCLIEDFVILYNIYRVCIVFHVESTFYRRISNLELLVLRYMHKGFHLSLLYDKITLITWIYVNTIH